MMVNEDDVVKFTVSQTTREKIKEVKTIMEEWASVLDMMYHHFEEVIKPALPENKVFVEATKDAYYEITSMPIEFYYVVRICSKLGVPIEDYVQYRDLVLRVEGSSKPKRRG